MPWSTFEENGRWCVHKLTPDGGKGEQVACHNSKAEADAQVKALYASEPQMKIAKLDEDEQLAFGWAYVSADADGALILDSDGESIEGHELEKAAYDFMAESRNAGVMHEGEPVGHVVESLMMTADKASAMGLNVPSVTGWWVGMKIDDPTIFAKVKAGEYGMFSIEGYAHEVADG